MINSLFHILMKNAIYLINIKHSKNKSFVTERDQCPRRCYEVSCWYICTLHSFKIMLRAKFKNENEQRAITPKVWCLELWFLCTALLLNEIYLPMKFHVDALHSFKVMLWTKFKMGNNSKSMMPRVMVLVHCTSPQWDLSSYHVDALHSFKVMLRTKKGRTEGRTSQSLYATLRGA